MELTFTHDPLKGVYEAEFEATADFNLHVERGSLGNFIVQQKTVADGAYTYVDEMPSYEHKIVIDLDIVGVIYPKYIKIVSETMPTMAVVTFNA